MKATISYDENQHKPSMFAKPVTRYLVKMVVAFSEEEQAIITQAMLADVPLHEYDMPLEKLDPLHVRLTINDCRAGTFSKAFDTPFKARLFRQEVTDDILPSLKNYLEGNRPLEKEPLVIEL